MHRYDGTFFKKNLKTHGTFSVGQMTMYDVGMASMFVSEADALTTLATVIGRCACYIVMRVCVASIYLSEVDARHHSRHGD